MSRSACRESPSPPLPGLGEQEPHAVDHLVAVFGQGAQQDLPVLPPALGSRYLIWSSDPKFTLLGSSWIHPL